jgi:MOSC domain-containing protein YiiM|uniref:MOSC domain-containing protein n=1 Tax=Cephaloticoccus sp. TaxID=1985742 RepID=UPI00404A7EAD
MVCSVEVHIHQIFISPGHNYFGHHGQPAGDSATVEVNCIKCVAGRGIAGDRFFDFKEDYKGQITFFSWDDYEAIKKELNVPRLSSGAFRRNVILSGVNLLELVGCRFELQGIEFVGTGEAKPCYWMNEAVAPGAEAWLAGRGGLRAKIIGDGMLKAGPTQLVISKRELSPVSAG